MMPLLDVQHLQKTYTTRFGAHQVQALADVSFTVEPGEYVAIMGESGSGKTTLLNILAALDRSTAGEVLLGGRSLSAIREKQLAAFRRSHLGFVFQDFNLLDTLTISENIALALAINKTPAKEVEPCVSEIAGKLNIRDILDKYPYQVSGGQKQRCACARALVNHPKLILADEPTGALDSRSARMLLETFRMMNVQFGATILMVTHDAFSASYCKRILFLKDGAIFHELNRGKQDRRTFLNQILDVLSLTGGDLDVE